MVFLLDELMELVEATVTKDFIAIYALNECVVFGAFITKQNNILICLHDLPNALDEDLSLVQDINTPNHSELLDLKFSLNFLFLFLNDFLLFLVVVELLLVLGWQQIVHVQVLFLQHHDLAFVLYIFLLVVLLPFIFLLL